jgi:lipopolysaccharide transport system ATP-binding protein
MHYRGRLASLLEVGTGFHRELTGRENIYLNGSILGMRRAEIQARFDAIVDFAGVEKFLDTPVKFYSSGMYVRLAFAVAAHLRTDILVVDEVLAVGDAQFQKKCLGKMQDVAGDGRTVLFVSHNMAAVQSLCRRGVVLEAGKLAVDADSEGAVEHYLKAGSAAVAEVAVSAAIGSRTHRGPFSLCRLRITGADKAPRTVFEHGERLSFDAVIEGPENERFSFGLSLRDSGGSLLVHITSQDAQRELVCSGGRVTLTISTGPIPLNHGDYYATFFVGDSQFNLSDRIADALSFTITTGHLGFIHSRGSILPESSWATTPGDLVSEAPR